MPAIGAIYWIVTAVFLLSFDYVARNEMKQIGCFVVLVVVPLLAILWPLTLLSCAALAAARFARSVAEGPAK